LIGILVRVKIYLVVLKLKLHVWTPLRDTNMKIEEHRRCSKHQLVLINSSCTFLILGYSIPSLLKKKKNSFNNWSLTTVLSNLLLFFKRLHFYKYKKHFKDDCFQKSSLNEEGFYFCSDYSVSALALLDSAHQEPRPSHLSA